jgi:hypothetical protein
MADLRFLRSLQPLAPVSRAPCSHARPIPDLEAAGTQYTHTTPHAPHPTRPPSWYSPPWELRILYFKQLGKSRPSGELVSTALQLLVRRAEVQAVPKSEQPHSHPQCSAPCRRQRTPWCRVGCYCRPKFRPQSVNQSINQSMRCPCVRHASSRASACCLHAALSQLSSLCNADSSSENFPTFHHHIHNSPPTIPVLSQLNPIYIHQPYCPKAHSGISFHLRLGLPSGVFPSGF